MPVRIPIRLLVPAAAVAFVCLGQVKEPDTTSGATRETVETVQQEIVTAINRRDRSSMEKRLATPFLYMHAGGAFDSRDVFLDRVAKGIVNSPADDVAEFDVTIDVYGAETAVRRSRLRRRVLKQERESWLTETRVFVKSKGTWLLASSQNVRLYEGPIIEASRYQRLAGEYVSQSGQKVVVAWKGYGFFVFWPDAETSSQVFPTSDADLSDELRRMHFTFAPDGRVAEAAEFRHRPQPPKPAGSEPVWRGIRR